MILCQTFNYWYTTPDTQIHNVVLTSSSCLDSLDIGQLEAQIYKPNTEKKKILCKTDPPSSIGGYSCGTVVLYGYGSAAKVVLANFDFPVKTFLIFLFPKSTF